MKDIDFLPEWYRSGQRRQVSYRTQCIALGGVFVAMIVWSLIARHSISRAEADLAGMTANHGRAENVSVELAGLESQLSQLQQRARSVAEIDSKIDVASVLAELSYLIDERVVVSKVEITAEKFAPEQKAKSGPGGTAIVKPVQTVAANGKNLPLGKVRFKVVIGGVAADASDVGVLMCKLEDSPYFGQVVLVFSRDTEIAAPKAHLPDTGTAGEHAAAKTATGTKNAVQQKDANIKASEFEIQCYLANYRES